MGHRDQNTARAVNTAMTESRSACSLHFEVVAADLLASSSAVVCTAHRPGNTTVCRMIYLLLRPARVDSRWFAKCAMSSAPLFKVTCAWLCMIHDLTTLTSCSNSLADLSAAVSLRVTPKQWSQASD